MQNKGVLGNRVINNFGFLYELYSCRTVRERWEMLQEASRDQLLALVEICSNVNRRNFRLTTRQFRRLKKHWLFLQSLGRVRKPHRAMHVLQKGEGVTRHGIPLKDQRGTGFVPAVLLPILVEAAAEILESYIPEPPKDDD